MKGLLSDKLFYPRNTIFTSHRVESESKESGLPATVRIRIGKKNCLACDVSRVYTIANTLSNMTNGPSYLSASFPMNNGRTHHTNSKRGEGKPASLVRTGDLT